MKHKIILSTFIAASLLFGGCMGTTSATISEEEARNIALEDAGLTADQVTFVKSNIDTDDGRNRYDVEFYTADGVEYDYEIDPSSGEILEYDFDLETIYD